jgi:hypothetical protein
MASCSSRLNLEGKLIGVTTGKLTPQNSEGINFAVATETIEAFLASVGPRPVPPAGTSIASSSSQRNPATPTVPPTPRSPSEMAITLADLGPGWNVIPGDEGSEHSYTVFSTDPSTTSRPSLASLMRDPVSNGQSILWIGVDKYADAYSRDLIFGNAFVQPLPGFQTLGRPLIGDAYLARQSSDQTKPAIYLMSRLGTVVLRVLYIAPQPSLDEAERLMRLMADRVGVVPAPGPGAAATALAATAIPTLPPAVRQESTFSGRSTTSSSPAFSLSAGWYRVQWTAQPEAGTHCNFAADLVPTRAMGTRLTAVPSVEIDGSTPHRGEHWIQGAGDPYAAYALQIPAVDGAPAAVARCAWEVTLSEASVSPATTERHFSGGAGTSATGPFGLDGASYHIAWSVHPEAGQRCYFGADLARFDGFSGSTVAVPQVEVTSTGGLSGENWVHGLNSGVYQLVIGSVLGGPIEMGRCAWEVTVSKS